MGIPFIVATKASGCITYGRGAHSMKICRKVITTTFSRRGVVKWTHSDFMNWLVTFKFISYSKVDYCVIYARVIWPCCWNGVCMWWSSMHSVHIFSGVPQCSHQYSSPYQHLSSVGLMLVTNFTSKLGNSLWGNMFPCICWCILGSIAIHTIVMIYVLL